MISYLDCPYYTSNKGSLIGNGAKLTAIVLLKWPISWSIIPAKRFSLPFILTRNISNTVYVKISNIDGVLSDTKVKWELLYNSSWLTTTNFLPTYPSSSYPQYIDTLSNVFCSTPDNLFISLSNTTPLLRMDKQTAFIHAKRKKSTYAMFGLVKRLKQIPLFFFWPRKFGCPKTRGIEYCPYATSPSPKLWLFLLHGF